MGIKYGKQVHDPSDADKMPRSCCFTTECWFLLSGDLPSLFKKEILLLAFYKDLGSFRELSHWILWVCVAFAGQR